MKIKIKYTWAELGNYAKNTLKSLLTGLIRLVWSVILLVINLAMWCFYLIVAAIRKAPCSAVLGTFLGMLLLTCVVHIQMKTKLTTAEWQRDNLEMKLDSINALHSKDTSYFKYQSYKAE